MTYSSVSEALDALSDALNDDDVDAQADAIYDRVQGYIDETDGVFGGALIKAGMTLILNGLDASDRADAVAFGGDAKAVITAVCFMMLRATGNEESDHDDD